MKKEVLHKQYPRLYSIYSGMLDRCLNEKNSNFHNYGGRGIVVCIEWIRSRELFIEWALGNGYQEHLTIDRIDVNGGYNPSNCRWATHNQQAQNKRSTKYVTYKGEQKKLFEWCDLLGLDYKVVYQRMFLCNWSVEDAFNPDLNHKPKEYTFKGMTITGREMDELLNSYRKTLNAYYDFYEPECTIKSRKKRIKELTEVIDNELFFFEFEQEPIEKMFKLSNSAA